MSVLAISIVVGACIFLAVFFSFDRIYANVWGKMSVISQKTSEVYLDMFYLKMDLKAVIRQQIIICVIGVILMFALFSALPIVALVAALGSVWFSWQLPLIYLEHFVRPRRIKQFSDQMIDGLTLMGNAMKSGMNLSQAFKICVDELSGPISQEFGMILDKNRIGQTIELGLETLSKRLPSEDIVMFSTSVNILKETGGNMTETFSTITKTIRERIKLQGKIEALTAQGMTSAVVVSILPWALACVLYLIDPVMMTPLFVHPAGWAILFCVLGLEVMGYVVIKKIVTIRV
ncbi:MAG: type II secretion system F family protein [Bdellovibrionota bacterium]